MSGLFVAIIIACVSLSEAIILGAMCLNPKIQLDSSLGVVMAHFIMQAVLLAAVLKWIF